MYINDKNLRGDTELEPVPLGDTRTRRKLFIPELWSSCTFIKVSITNRQSKDSSNELSLQDPHQSLLNVIWILNLFRILLIEYPTKLESNQFKISNKLSRVVDSTLNCL